MNIKPLESRIAVKVIESKEKTKGGIVLPDTAKEEKPEQGEVIAVGNACFKEEEVQIKVGDIVVFDKFSGNKINVDNEDYIIVPYDDVFAVIEK